MYTHRSPESDDEALHFADSTVIWMFIAPQFDIITNVLIIAET
jgi:hypothetical protein